MGHPNLIDRVKLQYYDPLEIGAVTAFTNLNCGNWAGRLEATADPALTMYYNRADLEARHLINDQISSFAIPQGYSIKLFSDDGFVESANSLVLDGQPWYDDAHTMSCINLNEYGWDDIVSSVAVYRTNRGAYAQGKWQAITSTESIHYKYHIGMSSSYAQHTQESMTYSMTEDMSMGVEFFGFGFETGISIGYEQGIINDTYSQLN